MKQFFKMAFATVVGIFLFLLISGLLCTMCLVGLVASSSSSIKAEKNSVFVLNLSGALEERSEADFMSLLMGGSSSSIGLEETLAAIKKAKKDNNIKGIYIEAGMFSSDSWASLQTLRKALMDFKKSGKWIIAYADTYTQGTYYLATAADKVYLNPEGQVDWHGLAGEPIFLKDVMAKFGVKMQLSKVGTYKSAPEQFTADHMSDANREQVTAYINGIWDNVLNDVSASRQISKEKLNEYADSLITFSPATELIAKKMIDGTLYTDEVKDVVRKKLGLDADEKVPQLGIAEMQRLKSKDGDGEEIAIYYAVGDIVDGSAQGLTGSGPVIDAQVVCRDLADLTEDDDVKAVILRVNSGGGSAYASEQIWRQVELLKKKKPVVVSMGGMAASGGYYISCNSNWIVAEPTTLTGSIGIFGMFPDASELLTQKLGVKFDEVKTNKYSNFGTMSRPFTPDEMSYIDRYVDCGYKLFRQRVADGRKMAVDSIEIIAQGRVWLGQDALKNHLVDQLGTIDDAVVKAAALAKLDEYHTTAYPAPKSTFEQIFSSASEGRDNYLYKTMKESFGEFYEPLMLLKDINNHNAIQARVPFSMNIR